MEEIIKIEESVTLQDLIELTKGTDPDKVIINVGFEVPDWTWLEITIDTPQ